MQCMLELVVSNMKTIIRNSVKKTEDLFQICCSKFSHLLFSWKCLFTSFLNHLIFQFLHSIPSIYIHLFCLIFFSLVGFFFLKASSSSKGPNDLDLFFTSVSAISISSMLTVNMEVFSNYQLIVITILMLIGGDVFLSLIKLQYSKYAMFGRQGIIVTDSGSSSDLNSENNIVHVVDNQVELISIKIDKKPSNLGHVFKISEEESNSMNKSINFLSYTILAYFLTAHMLGFFVTHLYFDSVPTAEQILQTKGIKRLTFSVFATVSSFANCGFIPTNENMTVFKKNSGLLLILTPQILIGSSALFPICLRLVIFSLKYFTKRSEFSYILKHYSKFGCDHLMSKRKCCYLGATIFGFILIQFLLFVSMEWNNSAAMDGLNSFQKTVASVFQVINARHAGESAFDISTLSPAVLVLFITMMYLPPHTLFLPAKDGEKCSNIDVKTSRGIKKSWVQNVVLSQLTYITIVIILICISEREKLKEDPLNFNVLNIIFEVISAYGNVGLSVGYSCKRQIKPDGQCKDGYYGFVGKWSNTGKLIIILVMLFGKLKNFYRGGGKAWKLS